MYGILDTTALTNPPQIPWDVDFTFLHFVPPKFLPAEFVLIDHTDWHDIDGQRSKSPALEHILGNATHNRSLR